jgi:hypothetical protein
MTPHECEPEIGEVIRQVAARAAGNPEQALADFFRWADGGPGRRTQLIDTLLLNRVAHVPILEEAFDLAIEVAGEDSSTADRLVDVYLRSPAAWARLNEELCEALFEWIREACRAWLEERT